jgi:hypothetical protein
VNGGGESDGEEEDRKGIDRSGLNRAGSSNHRFLVHDDAVSRLLHWGCRMILTRGTLRTLRQLAVMATVAIAGPAAASTASYGTVYDISVLGGKAIFSHTGTRTALPTCSTFDRWAFDVSTNEGQAKLSLLLTAHSTGKVISINGAGSCPDWSDTETAHQLVLH